MLGWYILLDWDYETHHVFLVSWCMDLSEMCLLERTAVMDRGRKAHTRTGGRVGLQPEKRLRGRGAAGRRSGHQAALAMCAQGVLGAPLLD